jgi:hypothetical protein
MIIKDDNKNNKNNYTSNLGILKFAFVPVLA